MSVRGDCSRGTAESQLAAHFSSCTSVFFGGTLLLLLHMHANYMLRLLLSVKERRRRGDEVVFAKWENGEREAKYDVKEDEAHRHTSLENEKKLRISPLLFLLRSASDETSSSSSSSTSCWTSLRQSESESDHEFVASGKVNEGEAVGSLRPPCLAVTV